MEVAEKFNLEDIAIGLVGMAVQAGRQPLCWLMGRDAQHPIWAAMTNGIHATSETFQMALERKLPPFMGLPCFPMEALGIALKTRPEPDSGFD